MAQIAVAEAESHRQSGWLISRAAAIFFAFLLIVAIDGYLFLTLRELQRVAQLVSHTQDVLHQVTGLRGLVRDAEVAQRAYLATGDEQYVARYRKAQLNVPPTIAALRTLTADNPEQQRRIDKVEALIRDDLSRLDESISRRRTEGAGAVDLGKLLADSAGEDQIRAATIEMQNEEERLYRERTALAQRQVTTSEALLVVGTLASLALIALIFRVMYVEAKRREARILERTAELSRSNDQLRDEAMSREKAEAEVRRTQNFLNTVIEHVPGMLFVKDAKEQRFVLLNKGAEDLLGYSREELIGKNDYDFFPKEQADFFVRRDREVLAARALRIIQEEQITTRHRGVRTMQTKKIAVLDENGQPQYLLGFSDDITDRKQMEQQLRQSQKMDAVGRLTGGIAHDFNNLLAVIMGNIDLLLEAVGDHPEQVELAKAALDGAQRGADLTHRLLAFARKQSLDPQIINLNARLPSMATMLQRTLGESIHVTMSLADDLWPTKVDPSQIEDALLNLAVNARDAMPKGGELAIETTNTHLDGQYAAQNPEVMPGDYVLLSVTDTGSGMASEVVERALEPFYTTKEPGQGTGLGLSMVYGFAKQSGGHLKLYSEVGFGTTVKLYLPRSRNETLEVEPTQAAAPVAMPRGDESILLVEDNPNVRQIARRILVDLGYKLREAESGPAALAILEKEGPFDLLFTDVVMPDGMTGYDLADAAHKLLPDLKVLFTTGYSKVQTREGNGNGNGSGNGHNVKHMIRKPYRKQELALKVRAVLDDKG